MQSREERSKQYFDTDIIGAAGYTPDDTDELFDRVSDFLKWIAANKKQEIEFMK